MDVLNVDLHVHVGCEHKAATQQEFVDGLIRRGVRRVGMMDHVELYLPVLGEWSVNFRKAMREKGWEWYPGNLDGLKALYADIDALPREPLRIVRGLEMGSGFADVPEEYMAPPVYLTHCFGHVDKETGSTWGQRAASRIRRFAGKIAPTGKPGVINHVLRYRLGPWRDRLREGENVPADECVSEDDCRRIADAIGETGLFLEVNMRTIRGHAEDPPAVLDLMAACIGRWVDWGVPMSFGSDFHQPPPEEFSPAVLKVVRESGLTIEHVRPLLERLGLAEHEPA